MIWGSIRLSTELEFVAIILTSYIVANRSLIANPVTYMYWKYILVGVVMDVDMFIR